MCIFQTALLCYCASTRKSKPTVASANWLKKCVVVYVSEHRKKSVLTLRRWRKFLLFFFVSRLGDFVYCIPKWKQSNCQDFYSSFAFAIRLRNYNIWINSWRARRVHSFSFHVAVVIVRRMTSVAKLFKQQSGRKTEFLSGVLCLSRLQFLFISRLETNEAFFPRPLNYVRFEIYKSLNIANSHSSIRIMFALFGITRKMLCINFLNDVY